MTVHCYTSITFTYLARARVLAWSLKRFHPDWIFTVCITDREPPGFSLDLEREPFDRVIWVHELPLENYRAWLFRHDVVEACTAIKGPVMKLLAEDEAVDRIVYLDPDIAVFSPLDGLLRRLDTASILLTPHQLAPETTGLAIRDNEICSLRHGTYNLGFVALCNDPVGRSFASWWNDRLLEYCYDEADRSLFVDQKWCDLVPALFDRVDLVRDPGCNVASWNLSNRKVVIERTGQIRVNDALLQFFHFTKLRPVGDLMTQRYAGGNTDVYELWAWYRFMIERMTSAQIPADWWYYGQFGNGEKITAVQRRYYRDHADLQQVFADPFACGPDSFHEWWASRNG